MPLYKIKIEKIINVLLALLWFSIIVDPSNSLLKIKDIVFGATIAFFFIGYHQISKFNLLIVLSLFFVFLFSVSFGLSRNYDFDIKEMTAYAKGWIFYIILLLTPKFSMWNKIIFPCVVISLIIVFLYILLLFYPIIEIPLSIFFGANEKMINITHRIFLGIDVTGVYYKTTPILILPLAYFMNLFLNSQVKKWSNFMISLLFFIALLMSGTRATMFAALFVVLLLIVLKFRDYLWGLLMIVPIFMVLVLSSYLVLEKLMSEKEYSINVKTKHFESQIQLFSENPDILILGQGIGSTYYTKGSNSMTTLSELSYMEIIRMFGIINGIVVILFHFLPIFFLYKNKPPNYLAFIIGYIAYLFIAGTNPLILNSFGNLVVFTAYSIGYRKI